MEIVINGETYKINIIRKNNKNMYLRVKDDLTIQVTTNYLVSDKKVLGFINMNMSSILKMINRQKKKLEKKDYFYLLGNKYDIIICNTFKNPEIIDDTIFTKSLKDLEKYSRDYALGVYKERLNIWYNKIPNLPYPTLKIRKMKGKWGYCNKRDKIVALSTELIKYGIDEIDYVIVHELCHFFHFNHSAAFWASVTKYKPNYKINRKVLKEE